MIVNRINDGLGIRCQKHEILLSFSSTEDMDKAVNLLNRSGMDFDIKNISDWDYVKYNTGDWK